MIATENEEQLWKRWVDRRKTHHGHDNFVENVTIANASQPEVARATPVLSRFNYDAMPSLK